MVGKYIKIIPALGVLILLSFALNSTSCNKKYKDCPKGSHKNITIKNNSAKKINWRSFEPDTVYVTNGSIPEPDHIVNSGASDDYVVRDCWESNFKGGLSLYFYIFNNDTVQALGWSAISGTNRGLLKRVQVNSAYLEANNFTISYP